jgi:hypothetical protein
MWNWPQSDADQTALLGRFGSPAKAYGACRTPDAGLCRGRLIYKLLDQNVRAEFSAKLLLYRKLKARDVADGIHGFSMQRLFPSNARRILRERCFLVCCSWGFRAPASAASRSPREHCTASRAFRSRRRSRLALLPKAVLDGFHRRSRGPRNESVSCAKSLHIPMSKSITGSNRGVSIHPTEPQTVHLRWADMSCQSQGGSSASRSLLL